jgi:aryl-alcohol dehydrogenase-like predicted oxidoreductase
VEASLRRLQTDHVDILTLHYPDPVTPPAETISAIRQLMEQGKILHLGVSNFDSQELTQWIEDIEIVTAQTPYNLLLRDVEEDLLPLCREKEITVLMDPWTGEILGSD